MRATHVTTKTFSPTIAKSRGLSLVELMIAMTLGLATVAAIGWIYFGTSKTYRTQDSIARLQEGARYAFEVIGNDLRMTGVRGCAYNTEINLIANYDTNWYTNFLEEPLSAVDKDGGAIPTLYSDALRVLRADVSREYIVSAHDPAGTFTVSAAHGLSPGALMLATDCDHVAVFEATAASGTTIGHGTTLGAPVGTSKTYAAGSRLYRLSSSMYYVDLNPAGVPSLYRQRPAAEELVEGVEDFQVTFGVDRSATADGEVDIDAGVAYVSAEDIEDGASTVPGGTPEERWNRVVSVRISLLMRTVEDNVVPSAQTYTFEGVETEATDRRLRKVFTHVVKLRNR